jgi:fatty acid desaturase
LDAEPDEDVDPATRAAAVTAAAPAADVPAGLGPDDDRPAVEPSALRMWITLIVQGVLGAVGGAVAWVGFRYLWLNLPVVALAAAVAATVGLVLLVRAIRGSDDPQTTILAVLVGLVVTISPAVLLLAVR